MTRYIDVEKAKTFFEEIDAGSKRAHSTLLTPYEFAEYLDEIPTADVQEVRHGKWVNESRLMYGPISAQCSVCELFSGTWLRNAPYKYCPHCGAKMGKE